MSSDLQVRRGAPWGLWLLAGVPALIVLAASGVLTSWAGEPEAFVSVPGYRTTLNAAVLLRLFGMFIAVVLVWWELRSRNAPRAVRIVAIAGGPLAYAITAFWASLAFFPIGPSLYYMLNPLTIAALGAQMGFASVVELLWRAVGRRRGRWSTPVFTTLPVVGVVAGFGVLYFTVIYNGGATGFYLFGTGYRLLFG